MSNRKVTQNIVNKFVQIASTRTVRYDMHELRSVVAAMPHQMAIVYHA